VRTHVFLALAVAVFVGGLARADDPPVERRQNKDRIEVPGTFVGIGEFLESKGANAQDSLHTRGALGLLDADGQLWSFVDNAKGHTVITNADRKGEEVKVLGWKYPGTRFLEISKFQVKEDGEWVAYDYCRVCGWEPGDNHDRDLCEDCAEEK
jgi:hypothetical protein